MGDGDDCRWQRRRRSLISTRRRWGWGRGEGGGSGVEWRLSTWLCGGGTPTSLLLLAGITGMATGRTTGEKCLVVGQRLPICWRIGLVGGWGGGLFIPPKNANRSPNRHPPVPAIGEPRPPGKIDWWCATVYGIGICRWAPRGCCSDLGHRFVFSLINLILDSRGLLARGQTCQR